MTKEKILNNRAFIQVYQATKSQGSFRKGQLFGRVTHGMAWTPVSNQLNDMATGKLVPFDETTFGSSGFTKLRDKIEGSGPTKWWTDGNGKRTSFSIGKTVNK